MIWLYGVVLHCIPREETSKNSPAFFGSRRVSHSSDMITKLAALYHNQAENMILILLGLLFFLISCVIGFYLFVLTSLFNHTKKGIRVGPRSVFT